METKRPPLTPFLLTMIILSSILSIRNWAFLVEYGFSSLVYLLLAAAIFFLPVSLVSAELASGWPEKGGIYVWIKEALGRRLGFLSIWFFWVSNVVWYPILLSFIACTLFYAIAPELASEPVWVIALMLSLFWGVALGNLRGVRYAGWFGTIAFLLGTLLPGLALICFGALWLLLGHPSEVDFSLSHLLPSSAHLNELIFLVSMVLGFAGMEMNAIHAKEVQNPRKNFPRAIFFSAFVIVLLTLMGIFSIGIVIPKDRISLTTALMEAASHYLAGFHLEALLPLFALSIALGSLGGISSWLIGTSKGLLYAAEQENLPPALTKLNRHEVPVFLLFLQVGIVSLLSFLFIMMPSLSSAFWVLTALASQLYLITYILMFVSALVLRRKCPSVPREYSVPGGKWGMRAVAGIGIASSLFAFIMGFIPPAQLATGSVFAYEMFLGGSLAVSILAPLFLLKRQGKPSKAIA